MSEDDPKKKSALTTRDPERDVIIKKRKKAGRKTFKNRDAEITDEMREQVCVWSSGGVKMDQIRRVIGKTQHLTEQFALLVAGCVE